MSTPESPLDKKTTVIEEELTLEERVTRLEVTLENAFNFLGKQISENDLTQQNERKATEESISKTLTIMNMSTLQNIVAIREVIKELIKKGVVDEKGLDEAIQAELQKAIEAQQQVMQAQMKAQGETTESNKPEEVAQ